MCCPGNVDVLYWKTKWFFFRHVQLDSEYNVMTINELSCDRPEVIFWLPHHLAWSHREDGVENPIRLTFLQEFLVLLLVPDAPGLRWMFWDAVLLPESLTVPFATGKMKFPLLCGVNTPFALSLRAWSSDASISSNSSMSAIISVSCPDSHRAQCIAGKFTRQDFCSKRMQSRLVFRRIGVFRPLLRTVLLVRQRAFRTACHRVSSSQTRDLECFADSSSTQ